MPLPRKPATDSQSISMPCSGITRLSKPFWVPNQLTRQPFSINSSATAKAGKTCPPVPPAIMTMRFAILTFPLAYLHLSRRLRFVSEILMQLHNT